MNKTIVFRLHQETKLPRKIIQDAPSQGSFDDYADYLVDAYDIDVILEESQKYLKSFGAWEDSELQDIDDNTKRILWIACLHCKEEKTQYFYMGE